MKKKLLSIIVLLIITTLFLSLAGCSYLRGLTNGDDTPKPSGEDGGKSGDEDPKITDVNLTGEIPFSLDNEFYLYLEVKSVAGALNPVVCSFTAIRKDETIYANYTYYKYKNATTYAADTYEEKYVEERILHEGINFRKSSAELTNSSGDLNFAYAEDWTIAPQDTAMTTTAQYIRDFLSGNHVADAPFAHGIVQTKRIPGYMSTYYIHKISLNTGSVEMYEDGTENMTFGVFTNDDAGYTPEQDFSAIVNKYRGTYFSETAMMNVKTWGNFVVYAAQANGSDVLKRTVSCKFTPTVSQQTFEAVLDSVGYTADPVLPEV